MTAVVTFDFHNTLVRCDRWFDLEVRSLPTVVYQAIAGGSDPSRANALSEEYRAFRREIVAHGREVDAVDGVVETFRRVGSTVSPEEIRPIIDATMAAAVNEAELMPGVQATIRYLRSHGVPLGVISSAVHHPFLEWALARFGVAKDFDVIASSTRAGYYKSRREIYDFALNELGAIAAHSVHVGDSFQFDHLAGKAVGLATVWIRETPGADDRNGAAPDLELSTLEGAGPRLLELLRSRPGTSRAD